MSEQAQEQVIYRHGNIQITNKRAILQDTTFAMSNVSSVQKVKKSPNKLTPAVLLVLGVSLSLAALVSLQENTTCLSVGIVMAIVGAGWLSRNRTKDIVRIGSASGESDGLISTNEAKIDRVVNAMNEAIVSRE